MSASSEVSKSLGEAFKRKSIATLILGVSLMIASMAINSQKDQAGNIGLFYSQAIIIFALVVQAITWIRYWMKNI